jgi:hypothetical protein
MVSCNYRMAALAAALAAGLVACAGSAEDGGNPAARTPSSASAGAATSAAGAGVSNGKTYMVDRSSSSGAATGGSWNLVMDTISGGDPKVAEAFNDAVHAAAKRLLDDATRGAKPQGQWTFETSPRVFFTATSISALISGTYNDETAAHPAGSVINVVIDSRSATPITLRELFTDDQAGLNRISEQSKILLPPAMGATATPMPNIPGNKPLLENFDSWIPTPAGLEIHFADYQFIHGTPVITVPWSAIDDLLAPGMEVLRQP